MPLIARGKVDRTFGGSADRNSESLHHSAASVWQVDDAVQHRALQVLSLQYGLQERKAVIDHALLVKSVNQILDRFDLARYRQSCNQQIRMQYGGQRIRLSPCNSCT